jgi:tripartite-type tricarboxylate transporter receptor subunit TctC
LTRQLAQRLQQRLGQPFIVENRPGAGGNISMEAVAKAPADGYTVCSATVGTLSINQFLYSKLSFDPAKDFVKVSTFWENTNVLVIPATHPAKDFKEWLAWARSQIEGITYSSSGVGTTPHLSGAAFAQKVGIKAVHVPFKGGAQASAELAAARIDCSIDNIVNQTPMLRGARVRALAVTYRERWPSMPDVPTMAEVGISDFVVTSWGALVLPAATPMAIVDKFSKVVQEISQETAMQEQFFNTGAKFVSAPGTRPTTPVAVVPLSKIFTVPPNTPTTVQQENMQALLSILLKSDKPDPLEIAEIHRELRDYDKAQKAIEKFNETEHTASMLIR